MVVLFANAPQIGQPCGMRCCWGRWIGFWLLILGLPGVAAEGKRPRILTSIPPLYSWATNVAGAFADVDNLLPADIGPHEYQFRPRDLRKIRAADIILLNGLGLESWFSRTILATDPTAARKVIEVAAGIPTNLLIYNIPELHLEGGTAESHQDHGHGSANPHVWLDPQFAKIAVTNLLTALQRMDAEHAPDYARNAAQYIERLELLDHDIRSSLAKLPKKDVITFHDAFPYFCRRYGLNLVGVIEEVPGTSPSPRYLADLSAVIRSRKVGVLFAEPQFDPRLARQLGRDLGVTVALLDTLETGRLGPSFYEDNLQANLRVLQSSLK
ncbi:MAG: hypothetical protein RIS76_3730 [Verrucomicrobiota bacterium]